jgi:4-coumarate--CoA ligase
LTTCTLIEHISSPANPTYTLDELVYQLTLTKTRLILAHPDYLVTALSAARVSGVTEDYVALFNSDIMALSPGQMTVNGLITTGLSHKPAFVERQLRDGEGKTKLAFLSFSSGTTGKPKVRSSW